MLAVSDTEFRLPLGSTDVTQRGNCMCAGTRIIRASASPHRTRLCAEPVARKKAAPAAQPGRASVRASRLSEKLRASQSNMQAPEEERMDVAVSTGSGGLSSVIQLVAKVRRSSSGSAHMQAAAVPLSGDCPGFKSHAGRDQCSLGATGSGVRADQDLRCPQPRRRKRRRRTKQSNADQQVHGGAEERGGAGQAARRHARGVGGSEGHCRGR